MTTKTTPAAIAALLVRYWGCGIVVMCPNGTAIIHTGYDFDRTLAGEGHRNYEWWTIADNGGEINVERVNDQGSLRSVPCLRIPLGRVAAAVAIVLRGKGEDFLPLLEEQDYDCLTACPASQV